MPRPADKAPGPPLDTLVPAHDETCDGVEALALACLHRVEVDVVAEDQDGRKGIAKLNDGNGADDRHEAEVIGNGGRDDEGDRPPDGHDDHPQDFAVLGDQGRGLEQIHEDVVVKDLDADVAVQARGDQPTQHGKHVAGRLPAVGADALVGDGIGVLALEVVDVAAVDEVDGVDEELRTPHRLDEVVRSLHLGHELDEELRAAVGKDTRKQAVDGADERGRVGQAPVVDNVWIDAGRGVGCDAGGINEAAGRAEDRDGVIGRAVRHDAHGDEDDKQIKRDGHAREPAIVA